MRRVAETPTSPDAGSSLGEAALDLERMFSSAYPELRALARARLRPYRSDRAGLDTSALVHETFLRYARQAKAPPLENVHFFRYASRVMRSVIVDELRGRMAQRRGGMAAHEAYTTQLEALARGDAQEALDVHDALDELGRYDPRLVDVVQMRYFAGLTDREIGEALSVTERTVRRDWEKARLLLLELLDKRR